MAATITAVADDDYDSEERRAALARVASVMRAALMLSTQLRKGGA